MRGALIRLIVEPFSRRVNLTFELNCRPLSFDLGGNLIRTDWFLGLGSGRHGKDSNVQTASLLHHFLADTIHQGRLDFIIISAQIF